ncbi:MAG: alkaline phosphatase family protein [Paracoccaceae bacterium]
MPKRNVLFIIVDQLRADCVTGALAKHVLLPNIAELRTQAVTFGSHFSVTNPCGPARASIFTGLYAMNHRSVRNGTPLSAHHTNLALEMRKSGVDPLLFGYTDTSHDPRRVPAADPVTRSYEGVMPGFHEIVEMCLEQSYPWRAGLAAKGYEAPSYQRFYDPVSPDPARAARPMDPAFYRAEDSDTAFLTDAFLEQMAQRRDRRWFALLTYIRPHPPLVAPAPYNGMYDPDAMPLPDRHAGIAAEEAVHPFMAAHRARPMMGTYVTGCDGQIDETRDRDVRMLRSLYFALASEVDAHLGRVIAFLRKTGQYDDTLIVLSADHGEMLGDHWMWGKQQVHDPAFRVPLIIRDPQLPATHGTTVEALTESVDVMPTILESCGLAVPTACDGRSLVPWLRGERPERWRDAVMMELDFGDPVAPTPMQRVCDLPLEACNLAILREERMKLVHFNAGLPPLLFDLADDPGEMTDLASDPAHRDTLLRLSRKLLDHRMAHTDQTLSRSKLTPDGALGFLA